MTHIKLLIKCVHKCFKIIAAEGEMNASKNLKEAADTIASSPAALQLR